MANANDQKLPTSKYFGTPEFSKLPNGPAKFEGQGRNPRASVSAFQVRVPISGTPVAILATCYGRKQADTGDVEFTITMPGLGGANARAVLSASDDVRAHFQAFTQAHAEAWPGYDPATDAAVGVLFGVKTANGGPRLVKRAPVVAELVGAPSPSVPPTGTPNRPNAGR